MDIAVLRSLRRSENFRPFALRLANGEKIVVRKRESFAVPRKIVAAVDPHDVSHTIDALHIVSVEEKRRT